MFIGKRHTGDTVGFVELEAKSVSRVPEIEKVLDIVTVDIFVMGGTRDDRMRWVHLPDLPDPRCVLKIALVSTPSEPAGRDLESDFW